MTIPSFSRLSEIKPAEAEKCLLYGGSGAGKTALFGSLGSRTLILNTGAGLDTLKSPWFAKLCPGIDPMTVDIIEKIDAAGTITEAVAYDMTTDAIDYAIQNFGDEFDNVVVDDASALRDYAMNKATEIAVATGVVKEKFKEIKTARDKPQKIEQILLEVAQWQGEMNLIKKFFAGTMDVCASAKKNLWVGAHEKFIFKIPRDEKSGKMIIGAQPEPLLCYPAFTGKQYPDQIQGMFDDVWHLEIVNDTRRIRLKRGTTPKYGDVMAKTRHDGVFTDNKGESVEYIDTAKPNLSWMLAQIRAASNATQLKPAEVG